MKIKTKIGYEKITITEPMICDVYTIELNEETEKFFIYSNKGYNTCGIVEYGDLDKAIQHVKKLIKNYFIDRCEDNPSIF
jgi:cystathionine beta-lyase family protein involved in aluminum resistance